MVPRVRCLPLIEQDLSKRHHRFKGTAIFICHSGELVTSVTEISVMHLETDASYLKPGCGLRLTVHIPQKFSRLGQQVRASSTVNRGCYEERN
jgi:hypothetical protein